MEVPCLVFLTDRSSTHKFMDDDAGAGDEEVSTKMM
jgi:hypothetical protein